MAPRAKKPAVKAGQVRTDDGGWKVLVGHDRLAGAHDVWRWSEGIWESRMPRTAEYLTRHFPSVLSEGNAIPTTPRAQDWRAEHDAKAARADEVALERDACALRLRNLHAIRSAGQVVEPTEGDAKKDFAALLAAAESDNAALVGELQQVLRWAGRYHHKDVAEALTQLLAKPHPGAALLERLKTLEAALRDVLATTEGCGCDACCAGRKVLKGNTTKEEQ